MKRFHKLIYILAGAAIMFSAACTKEDDSKAQASSNPQISKIDPVTAEGNAVLTLSGSGLGEITDIKFEKGDVPASFNPVFNTDNTVIFRVPDTANGGAQNIILTNKLGKQVTVEFNVIALPLVNDASNYNFVSGTEITLNGNNLNDVSSVTLKGTADKATVISSTKKQLVVKMPASTVNSAALEITNSTGPVTTSQTFVNLDKAFPIFTDDYGPGTSNGSWGPAEVSADFAKSGTRSFKATFVKGNWWANGFANWGDGIAYSPDYKYLSFWIKGGAADHIFYITGDQRAGGYGNSDRTAPITVPANVWTYFKIPLSSLELWKKGNVFKQLGFWTPGPDNQDETLYFDDVIFVK